MEDCRKATRHCPTKVPFCEGSAIFLGVSKRNQKTKNKTLFCQVAPVRHTPGTCAKFVSLPACLAALLPFPLLLPHSQVLQACPGFVPKGQPFDFASHAKARQAHCGSAGACQSTRRSVCQGSPYFWENAYSVLRGFAALHPEPQTTRSNRCMESPANIQPQPSGFYRANVALNTTCT